MINNNCLSQHVNTFRELCVSTHAQPSVIAGWYVAEAMIKNTPLGVFLWFELPQTLTTEDGLVADIHLDYFVDGYAGVPGHGWLEKPGIRVKCSSGRWVRLGQNVEWNEHVEFLTNLGAKLKSDDDVPKVRTH
jgi:hypothetical protein